MQTHINKVSIQKQNMNDVTRLALPNVLQICTSHIFNNFIYSYERKNLHTVLPDTTNLTYFCLHVYPGRKFTHTAYKEKIQINISSGSSLFFLLLSANTQPSVPLSLWWKTQMCSGVCTGHMIVWCMDQSILHLIHHWHLLFLQLTIYLIYLRLSISVITDYIRLYIHMIYLSLCFFLFVLLSSAPLLEKHSP